MSDSSKPVDAIPPEVFKDFDSLKAFTDWRESVSWMTPDRLHRHAEEICANGFTEPLTGRLAPAGQVQAGPDFREGMALGGICSRVRAVMEAISEEIKGRSWMDLRIYAAEAITPFAMQMRGSFPRFIGSEFTRDPALAASLFPIRLEDLTRLSFPDAVFDIVSTNEVLEHVPELDKALQEMARVLKPGGVHIGTHPFRYTEQASQVRSRLVDGEIEHLMEPEYHGDPMGSKGALVFELPGWDILDRCRAAGFSEAIMRFMMSTRHGYLTGDIGGVFVLICRK